ncbi:MAG TPA: FAD-dependent oxidoreductase, partial [Armatimonadota bacterium]|nr:FAD-dependent oxidoreductase [Armatimonadota bacterium]
MRVAVLGLGGVGTAAARFLAEAGHQVVGFEQFQLDHDRGSSYGASRIIRKVYPDALYAGLMEAAYPLWEALERESGEELLLRCGGFFFGPEDHPDMAATEAALEQVGVPYQRLSAAAAADRFPFHLQPGEYGLCEPQSGLLRASRCVLANARGARARGAELRENVEVEALDFSPSGVQLRCGAEWSEFDRVVITAGPWTAALLAPYVRLPLTVTRQQYAHFQVQGDAVRFSAERFPVWIDMASHFYGFPEHAPIPGAKVALHRPGLLWDPDSLDREVSEADNRVLLDYLKQRLPEL